MSHSTRRVTFLSALLFALLAPAGWALGQEASQPYIVIFDDDSVSEGRTVRTAMVEENAHLTRSALAGSRSTAGRVHVDRQRVEERVRAVETRGRFQAGNVYTDVVGGFSAHLTRAQLRTVQRDPSVARIVRDAQIQIDDASGLEAGGVRTTANPSTRVPAGIRRVGAHLSSIADLDSRDTRVNADVAIIDTGIERSHPDLNVVGGYNCTSRNRDRWGDDDGHGTHVAGIVGALDNRTGVVGVAPGARLWSVKVLDSGGRGYISWIICGIDWVTGQRERGDSSRPRIEVANMSLSFGMSGSDRNCGDAAHDMVHKAVCRSVARGTVYAVAAGNESRDARRNRPGAYDEVITVSAMADYDGRGGGQSDWTSSCPYRSPEGDDAFTKFSNYGADVDLTAPGRCVLSTYIGKRYGWMSGTSMAAPHVAGAAALYRAAYPRALPGQVKLALQSVGRLDWRTSTDPDSSRPERVVWVGAFRQPPDFDFDISTSSNRVLPGGQLSVGLSVKRVGGFDEAVQVALDDAPRGFGATPRTVSGASASLTVQVAPDVVAGRYPVTFRATSAGLERAKSMEIVVYGSPPTARFVSPPAGLTVQSETSVFVAWNESAGGSPIADRRVERQTGAIKTAGSCAGVRFATDTTRSRGGNFTDETPAGFCYRWRLTLTDEDGLKGTAQSGSVLVDATAPAAPVLSLAQPQSSAVDRERLGIDAAHLDSAGRLWVRGREAGSVALLVEGRDPQSGVTANRASVRGSDGWRTSWVGDPGDGSLRLSYSVGAGRATLAVSSRNGAGLSGPETVAELVRDGAAPTTGEWASPPSGSRRTVAVRSVRLDWTNGDDSGSGLAREQLVRRWRTEQTASGACRNSGWAVDGTYDLMTDRSVDGGLLPGFCYAWGVRMLDNVGNYSAESLSGTVVVEPS